MKILQDTFLTNCEDCGDCALTLIRDLHNAITDRSNRQMRMKVEY